MTIRFKNNSIEFESGTNKWVLVETNSGFDFTGAIRAQEFLSFANIGVTAGYTSGGNTPPNLTNIVDSFPFATIANATDVGDLTVARSLRPAGQSSSSFGYTSGGATSNPFSGYASSNVIDRYSFGTANNATDVGDLTVARHGVAGQSSSTHGYSSGGQTLPTPTNTNVIDRFPFAATGNASDVGDLIQSRIYVGGQSSDTKGYTSGGQIPPATYYNTIDSFPFSTNTNASDVGDLTTTGSGIAGQNSFIHGYSSGRNSPGSAVIDKFLFSTNANATSVGSLTVGRSWAAGQSSSTYGYTSGGYIGSTMNTIDRFPFATDSNASDVGDLTQVREGSAGQQV